MVTELFGRVCCYDFNLARTPDTLPSVVPTFIPTFTSYPCVFFVLFMRLFSDLHALEVELWIHCVCTRRTPFKSWDCHHANLCLVWRFSVMTCFLATTTFQMYSLLCPRQIIKCRNLTERSLGSGLDYGNFMNQCFRLQKSHAPPLKGLCPGLCFHSLCVFWTPNNTS